MTLREKLEEVAQAYNLDENYMLFGILLITLGFISLISRYIWWKIWRREKDGYTTLALEIIVVMSIPIGLLMLIVAGFADVPF